MRQECKNSIQNNSIHTEESITNDPGDHVEVRVFSNVTISSSIFNKNHVVVINQQSTLTFTNVVKVDSFVLLIQKMLS